MFTFAHAFHDGGSHFFNKNKSVEEFNLFGQTHLNLWSVKNTRYHLSRIFRRHPPTTTPLVQPLKINHKPLLQLHKQRKTFKSIHALHKTQQTCRHSHSKFLPLHHAALPLTRLTLVLVDKLFSFTHPAC